MKKKKKDDMGNEAERINGIWDRLEKRFAKSYPDYKLPPGASASDIHNLETKIGITLPEGLKASLARHNGVDEMHWPKGTLNSVEDILRDWEMWRDVAGDGEDIGSKDNDFIQPKWWDTKWIPLDADGAGNGAVIDMNPGPKGDLGQVIDMDHETGPNGPLYSCLAEYLEDCLYSI